MYSNECVNKFKGLDGGMRFYFPGKQNRVSENLGQVNWWRFSCLIVFILFGFLSISCKKNMEWDGVYIENKNDDYKIIEESKLGTGYFQTGGKNGRFFILDAGYNAPKKYYSDSYRVLEVDDFKSFYFKGTYFESETIKNLTLHRAIPVKLNRNNSIWHPDGVLKESGMVYMINKKQIPYKLKMIEPHKYNVVPKVELDKKQVHLFWINEKAWFFRIKESKAAISTSKSKGNRDKDSDEEIKAIMQSKSGIAGKIKKLKELSDSGYPKAALTIGVIYDLGLDGAKKNKRKAAKWYANAAERGNGQGQYMLGMCYVGAIGVKQDLEKAAILFQKAIANGVDEAEKSLKEVEENMWLAKTGWVSVEKIAKSVPLKGGKYEVTQNSFINHWAGEVIAAYYVKGEKTFRRLKIRVTWITDRSPYHCGQIIIKNADEIKDFTARSLAMKRCN